jgi:hypothetical protein
MRIILILFIGFLMQSCKSDNNKTEKAINPNNESLPSVELKDKNLPDYASLGYEIIKQDAIGKIKIGLDINSVENYIGKPDSITDLHFSEVNGEYYQEAFYYELGLELDFELKEDSIKTVKMVFAKSPCSFKTTKDIEIGSHYDSVLVAYDKYVNPDDTYEEQITAGTIYGGVIFLLENKRVQSILIGAGAE